MYTDTNYKNNQRTLSLNFSSPYYYCEFLQKKLFGHIKSFILPFIFDI